MDAIIDPGGLSPDIVVSISGKEYVRVADCDHVRVRDAYGDTKTLSIFAERRSNGAYVRKRIQSSTIFAFGQSPFRFKKIALAKCYRPKNLYN